MGQLKTVAWSYESHILLHDVDGRVLVCCLHWEEMVPGYILGGRQISGGNVMLWAMFCWKILRPGIYVVTMTHVTYLNIVADKIHPLMAIVFTNGSGL